VKRMPGGDRTKVAVLTLQAGAAYRAGADGYLVKGAVRADPSAHPGVPTPSPRHPPGISSPARYGRINTGIDGGSPRIHSRVIELSHRSTMLCPVKSKGGNTETS